MFSAFRKGPAASERGLCDIERVLFRVTKSRVRKLGSSCTTKINRYVCLFDFYYNRYIFAVPAVPGLSNLLTSDEVTLNNTQAKSYSPRPLTAGPKRNAENIESLLAITLMVKLPYSKTL